MVIRLANSVLKKFGYVIGKNVEKLPMDIVQDTEFVKIYEKCKPYTMTTPERLYSLYKAIEYTLQNNINGDFVECGVWKGGSSMMIALTLLKFGENDRKIYMYDTYEGMSEPTENDISYAGTRAEKLLEQEDKSVQESVWCYSSIDEVRSNLSLTKYPAHNIKFIKGKVEDTLLTEIPGKIALLRLDTDWYESTKIELEVLYPLLEKKGILIIDDFGFWEGAKKAVVEYFDKINSKLFLNRIDFTGRLLIKQ
jgi:O-methyltransferase